MSTRASTLCGLRSGSLTAKAIDAPRKQTPSRCGHTREKSHPITRYQPHQRQDNRRDDENYHPQEDNARQQAPLWQSEQDAKDRRARACFQLIWRHVIKFPGESLAKSGEHTSINDALIIDGGRTTVR